MDSSVFRVPVSSDFVYVYATSEKSLENIADFA